MTRAEQAAEVLLAAAYKAEQFPTAERQVAAAQAMAIAGHGLALVALAEALRPE